MEISNEIRNRAADLIIAMTANAGEADLVRSGQMDSHAAVVALAQTWTDARRAGRSTTETIKSGVPTDGVPYQVYRG